MCLLQVKAEGAGKKRSLGRRNPPVDVDIQFGANASLSHFRSDEVKEKTKLWFLD